MDSLIKFNTVSKIYPQDIVALENITFTVNPGEFAFIVGPSGAGKSTLMKLLIRQEMPTDGSIFFEDIEVEKIPSQMVSKFRQKLGVVFQDLKLIPSKTVEENIQFALEITDKSDEDILDTSKYLMDVVKINDRAKLFPEELSGGEKQKVAIARALANNPKLLIADEPTGNLDPETSIEILNILKAINNWGTTVVVITHDDYIVDALQTRVIRIDKGKIIDDRVGGYFNDVTKRKNVLKKLEAREIQTIQEVVNEEKKGNLKEIVKKKSIRKKLKANGVDTIDDVFDKTEDELKKMDLNDEEIKELLDDLHIYLSTNKNE